MKYFLFISALILSFSCASTQKIKDNLYLADCDGVFGDCKSEMKRTCPNGHKVIASKNVLYPQALRTQTHFECI